MVKDLAARMGGSVRIVDGPGTGALFRVELPLAAVPFARDGVAPARSAVS